MSAIQPTDALIAPPLAALPLCLGDLLAERAAVAPDAVAIAAPGRAALSYGALHGQAQRVVAALNARGIGRGDRVAVVLPNGPEMAVAFLAVAAGATCAPLNAADELQQARFNLDDLHVKALVALADSTT